MEYTTNLWHEALSALSEDDRDYSIGKQVLHFLEDDRIYLETDLSLTRFCSMIGTNTTYFSSAINHCFGCNMRHLINWYRIQYAKVLLKQNPRRTSDLPRACGFASKSAFYISFKQMEGMTPIQFIALHCKDSPGGNLAHAEDKVLSGAYRKRDY
jgi:AraC-like DNA-binding protein